MTLLRLTLKDLLFFVENSHSAQDGTRNLREFLVPTTKTISSFFPIHVDQTNLQNLFQANIQNTPQASIIIICLLSTSIPFKLNAIEKPLKYPLNPFQISWTLNSLTRLWSSLFSAQEHLASACLSEQLVVFFLEILRSTLSQLNSVTHETVNLSRTSILFSQIIADLVLLEPAELVGILEKSISISLLELAGPFQTSPIVLEAFDEYLLPILTETTESRSHLDGFGIDLQVCSQSALRQKKAHYFKAIVTADYSISNSEQCFDFVAACA